MNAKASTGKWKKRMPRAVHTTGRRSNETILYYNFSTGRICNLTSPTDSIIANPSLLYPSPALLPSSSPFFTGPTRTLLSLSVSFAKNSSDICTTRAIALLGLILLLGTKYCTSRAGRASGKSEKERWIDPTMVTNQELALASSRPFSRPTPLMMSRTLLKCGVQSVKGSELITRRGQLISFPIAASSVNVVVVEEPEMDDDAEFEGREVRGGSRAAMGSTQGSSAIARMKGDRLGLLRSTCSCKDSVSYV